MATSTARPKATRSSTASPLAVWLGLALLVILADQLTKTLVLSQLALGESRVVSTFFNLVRVHNTGAAFSFLADADGWQRWFFVVLGTMASALIVWMLHSHAGQRLFSISITLILGGALGNVIDRLLHGYVVDFVQFHASWLQPVFAGGYFPSFNVADSAITVGAAGLLLDELLRVRRGS